MNRYLFKDIVKKDDGFLRGPFGSALKKSLFVPKGVDTYKVYEQSTPLYDDESFERYHITKDYFDSTMYRFEAVPGDFLVSCSGVNYGAICQLSQNAKRGVINQALLRIRLNNEIVEDDYFLYLFRFIISKKITSGTGDSTIPNFPSIDIIKKIDIELPSLNKQKQISTILKKIDNRIKNNNKISEELESLAKTIYDYWFLQFEFLNEEGKPYKSSGGKMVYNDELKRKIPEGWDVKTLGEIISESEKSKVQVNGAKDVGEYPFFTSGESIMALDNYFVDGFNIFLNTGGNPDIKAYQGKCAYSTDTWCINAGIYSYLLYYYLLKMSPQFEQLFFAGSGLKHLQKDALKKQSIIIPDRKTIDHFNTILNTQWNIKSNGFTQNKKLASLRDWLLPMLMNGQVSLSD